MISRIVWSSSCISLKSLSKCPLVSHFSPTGQHSSPPVLSPWSVQTTNQYLLFVFRGTCSRVRRVLPASSKRPGCASFTSKDGLTPSQNVAGDTRKGGRRKLWCPYRRGRDPLQSYRHSPSIKILSNSIFSPQQWQR